MIVCACKLVDTHTTHRKKNIYCNTLQYGRATSKRTKHLLTLTVICWRFSTVWKFKSPPCMWYSASWRKKGLLFCYKQLFEQFSNMFNIEIYCWLKAAIHHSLTNKTKHAGNQIQYQTHLSIASGDLSPCFSYLVIKYCTFGIISGFKFSSHLKSTGTYLRWYILCYRV